MKLEQLENPILEEAGIRIFRPARPDATAAKPKVNALTKVVTGMIAAHEQARGAKATTGNFEDHVCQHMTDEQKGTWSKIAAEIVNLAGKLEDHES